MHQFKLANYVEARSELNHALALYRELGDRKGEADARAALALIDTRRGDNAAARLELAFVLEIYREIGDRDGEAATRHSLAGLYHGEGLLDAAHSELTDVAVSCTTPATARARPTRCSGSPAWRWSWATSPRRTSG